MRLSIGEILQQGSKLEGDEQVAFMRKHWSPALGSVIQHAVEPQYQFDLPDGAPPYKKNVLDDQESNLYAESRRLYVFLKPHKDLQRAGFHVKPAKKEMLWIQLLENISQLDAEVMIEVSQNRLPWDWKVERLKEIYPGLLSPNAEDGPEAEVKEEPKQIEDTSKNDEPEQVEDKPKPAPKKKAPAKKKTATGTAGKSTRKKAPTKKKAPARKKKPVAKKKPAGGDA